MGNATKKVNVVIRHIETDDTTQANRIAMAAALYIVKEVGVKKDKRYYQPEKGYQETGKGKTRRNWRERKEKY